MCLDATAADQDIEMKQNQVYGVSDITMEENAGYGVIAGSKRTTESIEMTQNQVYGVPLTKGTGTTAEEDYGVISDDTYEYDYISNS